MGAYKSLIAEGKRSLMEAALRLAHAGAGLTAIGIRELAREANLNPNTFYKHFDTMEDLGLALIDTLGGSLRQPMQALRIEAASNGHEGIAPPESQEALMLAMVRRITRVNRETVRLLFDFVDQNPMAISLAVRELHGSSAAMRAALRAFMADCAADMAADIRALNLLPFLEDTCIDELARLITQQMLTLALDYLEQVENRAVIRQQAEAFLRTVVLGTVVQQDIDSTLLVKLLEAYRTAKL